MEKIQIENIELFLKTSNKIHEHKQFILKQDIDSLNLELRDQESDEPDYTQTMLAVNEIIQHFWSRANWNII